MTGEANIGAMMLDIARDGAKPELERIRQLALAMKAADDGTDEAWIRAEVRRKGLIRELLASQGAYREACDAFFLAPIQEPRQ